MEARKLSLLFANTFFNTSKFVVVFFWKLCSESKDILCQGPAKSCMRNSNASVLVRVPWEYEKERKQRMKLKMY
jgi:hypothetical protein